MKLKFSFLCLVTIFMVSCSSQISSLSTPAFLPDVTITPLEKTTTATFNASASETPTNTPVPIQATQTATSTATQLPFQFQTVCPSIGGSNDIPSDLTGTIVLSGENYQLQGETFLPQINQKSVLAFWNLETGEKHRFGLPEKDRYYYYSTSLDHKRLALATGETIAITTTMIILDQEGNEYDQFLLPGDWTMFKWANEGVLIRRYRLRGEENGMILYHPDTGEHEELRQDFPNLFSDGPLDDWGTFTLYNPQLTLVVYPHLTGERSMILWDNRSNQEIIRVPQGNWLTWSSSGNQLAFKIGDFTTRDEIYLLSNEGKLVRATNLAEIYDYYQIETLSWSPNGRYLNFWLRKDFDPTVRYNLANLAVLDTHTGQLVEYCFESDPYAWRFGDYTLGYLYFQVNGALSIWSPDSRYLLVEGIDLNDDPFNKRQTYLVDIQEQTIVKIADDARPVSWMASP